MQFAFYALNREIVPFEEFKEEFLALAHQTTFLDDCLCSFLNTGLNTVTRAQLSGEGLQGSLVEFMEWVLASCGSPLSSQNHPVSKDRQHEPTTNSDSNSAVMFKPAARLKIGTEPEHCVSDQLCEPAAPSITGVVLVEYEGMEVTPNSHL